MSDIDIKAARRKLGWSARVLAEHSGVSMRTIQRMELENRATMPLLRRAVEQALENGEVAKLNGHPQDEALVAVTGDVA